MLDKARTSKCNKEIEIKDEEKFISLQEVSYNLQNDGDSHDIVLDFAGVNLYFPKHCPIYIVYKFYRGNDQSPIVLYHCYIYLWR